MENKIWLLGNPTLADAQDLEEMYRDSQIYANIGNVNERSIISYWLALIKKDNDSIGFIHLVPEYRLYDILYADMGIVERYRGVGYGKQAMILLKQTILNDNDLRKKTIIGESDTNNKASNKMNNGLNPHILTKGYCNFYAINLAEEQPEVVKKLMNRK